MEERGERERSIRLWPEGRAPYAGACAGQAEPTLAAFPADGMRGAVVICPGGGYKRKAPHEGKPVARMLREAGISAFVLDYRVAPRPFEAPLADALRAVRTVRAMGYERVAVLGFSAGAHVACCAATLYDAGDPNAGDELERLSARPDALISCYGVVSMLQYAHLGSIGQLLGENAGSVVLRKHFSAELNITPDTPPAFIWHTAEDASVPVENSLNLAAAYSRNGVPFELHVFPRGRHGLGLAAGTPGACRWPELCVRWLQEQGYTD